MPGEQLLVVLDVVYVGRAQPPDRQDENYEFTITFARVDHEIEEESVPGVVVSRINLSPRFMRELIDAMEDNFSKWHTREGIKNLPEAPDR